MCSERNCPPPDALDSLLVWALVEWEAGRDRGRSSDEIKAVDQGFFDWFVLDEGALNLVENHEWRNLEWVDVILQGLWDILLTSEDKVWSIEALNHIAECVVNRIPRVRMHAANWVTGSPVAYCANGERSGIEAVLLAGFPGSGSLIGRNRDRFKFE